MERTGWWDIKDTEEYIYAAFKKRPDEGIQETGTEFGQAFLPWNASSEGSIFQFSDAAIFACFVPERISVLSESVEWLILFVPKLICVYEGTG